MLESQGEPEHLQDVSGSTQSVEVYGAGARVRTDPTLSAPHAFLA